MYRVMACLLALVTMGFAAAEQTPPNPPQPAVPAPMLPPHTHTDHGPRRMSPGQMLGVTGPIRTAEAADADPAYLLQLAQTHLQFGVVERAEPLLKSALEKSKDPEDQRQATSLMAITLQRKGDLKGAAEYYERVVAATTEPSNKFRSQLALAECYAGSDNSDKAEKLLTELVNNPDQSPMASYQRQEAQRQMVRLWEKQPARMERVIADLEKSVAANPKDTTSLERLVEIYGRSQPEKVSQCLEKLAVAKPDDKYIPRRLLNQYQTTRQYDKALETGKKIYESAQALPEKRALAMQIGQVLVAAGKKDEAVKWMQENYPKDGASSFDFQSLSAFYDQAGSAKDSDEANTQALAAAKTPFEKSECQFRIAELAIRRAAYDRAEEIVQGMLNDFKDNAHILQRASATLQRIRHLRTSPSAPPPEKKATPAPAPEATPAPAPAAK